MLPLLILLFTVVPALELYLLFAIGAKIGGLNTILVIITTGILGAALAKSQGLQILRNIQDQANRGELPGDQIIQGLMVFAGGLLLLTPGFMTDVIGFSLVLPGTRHLLMVLVKKMLHNSIQNGNFQVFGMGGGMGGSSQGTSGNNGFYSYSTYTYTNSNGPENFSRTESTVVDDDNVVEVEFTKKE
jgi:UPF0716 protein FxsA